VRPNLALVGQERPGIHVGTVRPEALAACFNAYRTGELINKDEVTAFELMLAHAYTTGRADERREMAEVS
jgi:hypothetical protein